MFYLLRTSKPDINIYSRKFLPNSSFTAGDYLLSLGFNESPAYVESVA